MRRIIFTYFAVFASGIFLLLLLAIPGGIRDTVIIGLPVLIIGISYFASRYLKRGTKLSTSRHFAVFVTYFILLFMLPGTLYEMNNELSNYTTVTLTDLLIIFQSTLLYTYSLVSLVVLHLYINIFVEPDDKETGLSNGAAIVSILVVILMIIETAIWYFGIVPTL